MELLRVKEAAAELNCSTQTIFNYIKSGILQRVKPAGLTYVTREDIEKLKLPQKIDKNK